MSDDNILLEQIQTEHNQYQVIEMKYDGRMARVLFSGNKQAAQSGIPLDNRPDLLFDYNQRFMELLTELRPKRVLLIGGGAFTLPTAAHERFKDMSFDVVELDKDLPALAERHFDLVQDDRLRVFNDNGRSFIDNSQDKYDAIFIDAFSHTAVPRSLITVEAIVQYHRHLTAHGFVAVNTISALYGNNAAFVQRQYSGYRQLFDTVKVYPASRSLLSFYLPQNFVVVAHKRKPPAYEIRYGMISPDEIADLEPWHDSTTADLAAS